MNTHETLLLKTLQAKQLHKNGGDTARFIDAVLDQNPEEAERLTKNVCARIPLALAEEMEGFGSLLDLNKREIITMACVTSWTRPSPWWTSTTPGPCPTTGRNDHGHAHPERHGAERL